MLTAQAQVPTDRASRYLVQLCRHTTHMHGERPGSARVRHRPPAYPAGDGQMRPEVQHVDYSDTCGTIRFTQGLCTLWATADTLTLRVDATDEATLHRLQDGITRRLEMIGRRDHLTVGWQWSDTTPGSLSGDAAVVTPAPREPAAPRPQEWRGLGRRLLWVGAAALVIVGHMGMLGGVLAAATWAKWGFNALLAIIAVKVIFVGIHLIGGRYALRHRNGPLPQGKRLPGHGRGLLAHTTMRQSAANPTPAAAPAPSDQTAAAAEIAGQEEHA